MFCKCLRFSWKKCLECSLLPRQLLRTPSSSGVSTGLGVNSAPNSWWDLSKLCPLGSPGSPTHALILVHKESVSTCAAPAIIWDLGMGKRTRPTLSTSGERGMETTSKKCNGCTPTSMANIKKTDNSKCWWGYGETGNPYTLLVGM